MEKRVTWSRRAKQDLISVRQFILKDSEFYAFKTVEDIVARTRILLTFPESGRIVPEIMQDDVREVFKGSYRIVYQIKPYGVRILRVANHYMLFEL